MNYTNKFMFELLGSGGWVLQFQFCYSISSFYMKLQFDSINLSTQVLKRKGRKFIKTDGFEQNCIVSLPPVPVCPSDMNAALVILQCCNHGDG